MLIDEAAELLVQEYTKITKPTVECFSQFVGILCYLYPAARPELIKREVVRALSQRVRI